MQHPQTLRDAPSSVSNDIHLDPSDSFFRTRVVERTLSRHHHQNVWIAIVIIRALLFLTPGLAVVQGNHRLRQPTPRDMPRDHFNDCALVSMLTARAILCMETSVDLCSELLLIRHLLDAHPSALLLHIDGKECLSSLAAMD